MEIKTEAASNSTLYDDTPSTGMLAVSLYDDTPSTGMLAVSLTATTSTTITCPK